MYLYTVGEYIIMENSTHVGVKLETDTTIIIFTILSTFLCAVSAFINIATMVIVICLPKQTPFSKLFVNLAICDILGTFSIYIGDGFYRAGIHWHLLNLQTLNSIFIVAGICFNLLFMTSTITLLVFAIMRFIAIKKPHLFKLYFASSKRILIYISLCWIISTFVALPSIICEYSPKQKCGSIHGDDLSDFLYQTNIGTLITTQPLVNGSINVELHNVTFNNSALPGDGIATTDAHAQSPKPCLSDAAYTLCYQWNYSWAAGKALILLIVVLLYLYVSRDLLKRSASFRENDDTARRRAHDQHAFITIVILMVSLVLLGLPYIVVKVYRRAKFDQTTIDVYQHFIIYFPYINFILDPLVYSIRSPDIYAKYKSIFERILCRSRRMEHSGNGYGVVAGNRQDVVLCDMPNGTKNHGPRTTDVT